jgi:hypothetical protein
MEINQPKKKESASDFLHNVRDPSIPGSEFAQAHKTGFMEWKFKNSLLYGPLIL